MKPRKIDLWWTEFKELVPLCAAGKTLLENGLAGDLKEKLEKSLIAFDKLKDKF